MGGNASVLAPAETEALASLTGPHVLPKNHPTWTALHGFAKDLTGMRPDLVNTHLQSVCGTFGKLFSNW